MDSTAQLIDAGLTITVIGMSVVFLLLTTLVGVVTAMSALCRRFAPEPARADGAAAEDEVIGVIAAAIRQYRRGRDL